MPADQLQHIVVLMMENRSFDQMLGWLRLSGGRDDVDGLTGAEFEDYNGRRFQPFHFENRWTMRPDPDHSGSAIADQLRNGFVQCYARQNRRNPEWVMGYYTDGDLPAYGSLARQFCVCDRWFASIPGSTWPNRLWSLAGTSGGLLNNPKVDFGYFPFTNVFDLLTRANVPWTYYYSNVAFLWLFKGYRKPMHSIAGVPRFFSDVANGRLPAVSWIDPRFVDVPMTLDANDDHPPSDIRKGQFFVGQVYNALASNPALFASTMLVITYDEHGGFYDHVRPPDGFGVRVPALVCSPLVAPGSVSSTVYDHTSIIRTILARFAPNADGTVPQLGERPSQNDLLELLDQDAPRTDYGLVDVPRPPRDDAFPPSSSTTDDRDWFSEADAQPAGGDPDAPPDNATLLAALLDDARAQGITDDDDTAIA
jgi:phospholipase C